jgi:hypothetical protein
MKTDELVLGILLVVSNSALGLVFAVILSRRLSNLTDPPIRRMGSFVLIVGMYFLECLAFAAGMATQIFTIGLAFMWGIVLGRLLHRQSPIPSLLFSLWVVLYTCLPTITFGVLVPVAWALAGNSLINLEAGIRFGIPEWIPWPLGTVLGFALALVLGTVLLKSVITVGEVSMILHYAHRPGANRRASTEPLAGTGTASTSE